MKRASISLLAIYFVLAAVPTYGQHATIQCNNLMARGNQLLSEIDRLARLDIANGTPDTPLTRSPHGKEIDQQYGAMIKTSREFVAYCADIYPKRDEAGALNMIGDGLICLGQNDDAIPVLKRCVATVSDYAPCWDNLGWASYWLGRRSDARAFWEKTLETGAIDELNTAVIASAKRTLKRLELDEQLEDQLRQVNGPVPDTPAPATSDSADVRPFHDSTSHSFGTGLFINDAGYILTSNHVVEGCKSIATREGKQLQVSHRNTGSDLAILKANVTPSSVAVFRAGSPPKLGDAVVAFGFPLPGILSSGGNISTGVISATSGLQNDMRFVQISAPVQPGNSGGPLFDSSGHVIGVVVAKLDALQIAQATGDVPQNVNFAVHWSEVQAFLGETGIQYRREPSNQDASTRSIAGSATKVSIAIDCTR